MLYLEREESQRIGLPKQCKLLYANSRHYSQ